MSETPLLPDTNTIALWMLVAITIVIAAKVITGTMLGQKRKEIYKIREKLFGIRQELGHHQERVKVAKDMISFAVRQKQDLEHQIEITKSDLKALAAADDDGGEGGDGEAPERGDPTIPAHMRTRGEGLFE
ncbi:MAG: hypothetical protein HOM68_27595 [Gemmatimonadetes bacterium]|jgi:hypothetical protein|nr:hypothetical protein [Gemmatimonadota bacterium]MBT4609321.1 hypothetical protein [Gemmatimonadota bacterium]MBT5060338.1 hypothetical protein [Gemmatimonadota bacterium]MBT5144548.1 hypothetical protein [Gemmatimonadota bacterium]MBT5591113.1 hypothetical protein [Gemmatimonadota bacterium]